MGDSTDVDYRLVCRTCLATDVEFYKLEAPIISDDHGGCVSFLDCLKYCTRLENFTQLPEYICVECSSSLHVAYNFVRNAVQAHEILCKKLHIIQRNNGQSLEVKTEELESPNSSTATSESCRYRCRACGEKLASKKALKDHAKLHMDMITYSCQECSYESKDRSCLIDHYNNTHGLPPTRDQLKPKTVVNTGLSLTDVKIEDQRDDVYRQMEKQHNPKDENLIAELQGHLGLATLIPTDDNNTISGISAADIQVFNKNFNEVSVGNEIIVLPDGTVQQVMNNGVVIEYINAGDESAKTLQNSSQENGEMIEMTAMEFEDIIEEDNFDNEVAYVSTNFGIHLEEQLPEVVVEVPSDKKIRCKICDGLFSTQEKLKMHMLSHNEIPHFFCDLCDFYTFFKVDLMQHYKNIHKVNPTPKQLLPKNTLKSSVDSKLVFACDLCLYETNTRVHLRKHYLSKHQVNATDVQLRPALDESEFEPGMMMYKAKIDSPKREILIEQYCKLCGKIFYSPKELSEHYKQHKVKRETAGGGQSLLKTTEPVATATSRSIVSESPAMTAATTVGAIVEDVEAQLAAMMTVSAEAEVTTTEETALPDDKTHADGIFSKNENNMIPECSNQSIEARNSTLSDFGAEDLDIEALLAAATGPIIPTSGSVPAVNRTISTATSTATATTVTSSSNFILPADAVPQVVETELTIPNDMDFDFNGDAIFEDFEDDDNDNEDDFQELLLTSDDDFEDLLEDQASDNAAMPAGAETSNTASPHCVHCNKKFFSQYQFENHMFVHRGLAPYRCELCTNLYNTKRALIRHYKAVHKKIPTRDMIQAKGDKVSDKTPVEKLHLREQKEITLMCAKCPYESTDRQSLKLHLTTNHSTNNEEFILEKLPFECPRCIRSFLNKARLVRHLERSHSVATIIQQSHQQSQHQQSQQPHRAHDKSLLAFKSLNTRSGNEKSEIAAEAVEYIKQEESNESEQQYHGDDGRNLEITYLQKFKGSLHMRQVQCDDRLATPTTQRPSKTLSETEAEVEKPELDASAETTTYQCNACAFSCTTIELLSQHSKDEHAYDNWRDNFNFACHICQCKYKTISLLKHHLKRHIGRKYFCDVCPKSYINRIELDNHKMTHTGEMPHACDMCPKKFRYQHHLKRHRDVAHYGKRVVCSVENCGRQFTTQAQLKIHMWNHNGMIPYRCKHCDRVFKKRELLRQHSRKAHHTVITEEEIAEIYRNNVGYTNPHDFTVAVADGQILRRELSSMSTASCPPPSTGS